MYIYWLYTGSTRSSSIANNWRLNQQFQKWHKQNLKTQKFLKVRLVPSMEIGPNEIRPNTLTIVLINAIIQLLDGQTT